MTGAPSRPDASADDGPPGPGRHPGLGTGARLWLVRHAEVHEDWRGRAYGDLDVPLSAAGREATGRLARAFGALAPRAVLSSPLERALALGRGIAERAGVPLDVRPELREIHRGSWQGEAVSDLHRREPDAVAAFYADPWRWRGHGGESDSAVLARCWPVVEAAVGGVGAGEIVCVTHYNVIRAIATFALGLAPPRSFAFRVDPGRAALLADTAAGWVLCHSNVGDPSLVLATREATRP